MVYETLPWRIMTNAQHIIWYPTIFSWVIILPWARGDTNQAPVLIYSTNLLVPVSLRNTVGWCILHARISCMKFVIPMFSTADQWAETKSSIMYWTHVWAFVLFCSWNNSCTPKIRVSRLSITVITKENHEYVHFFFFVKWRIYAMSLHITIRQERYWMKKKGGEIYEESGNSM